MPYSLLLLINLTSTWFCLLWMTWFLFRCLMIFLLVFLSFLLLLIFPLIWLSDVFIITKWKCINSFILNTNMFSNMGNFWSFLYFLSAINILQYLFGLFYIVIKSKLSATHLFLGTLHLFFLPSPFWDNSLVYYFTSLIPPLCWFDIKPITWFH